MRCAMASGSSTVRSASIFSHSCSWIPTLAQRCHSATSRRSCTLGVSAACAAFRRCDGFFVVVPRRERRHVRERGAHVAQHPRGGLQREVRFLRERLGAPEELIEAVEALAAVAGFGLAGLLAPFRLARRLGIVPCALFGGGLFGAGPLLLFFLARASHFGFDHRLHGHLDRHDLLLQTHDHAHDDFGLHGDDWFHDGGGGVAGGAFIELAQHGAGALGGALVLRARGDLFQIRSLHEAIHGGDDDLLELAVDGHGENVGPLVHAFERRLTNPFEGRVPGNRSEQMRVRGLFEPPERAKPDGFPRGSLRNLGERLIGDGIGQRVHRRQSFGFADALERIEGDVAQHAQRIVPHALVGVVARDPGQRRRVEQLGDRGTAHADVVVFPRGGHDLVVLAQRQLGHVRETHGRIRVILA